MDPLFIIGYMGVGKTTVGQILAEKLGRSFSDLDQQIEEDSDIGIPRFFEIYGESAFRRKEADFLERISNETEVVIACGGATPCYRSNLDLMKASGTLIYLKASPKTLSQHLQGKGEGRPKLSAHDESSIEAHLRQRESYYQEADIIIPVEDESPEKTAKRVFARLYHSR